MTGKNMLERAASRCRTMAYIFLSFRPHKHKNLDRCAQSGKPNAKRLTVGTRQVL
uniref:Uncharacterized protein n=1 Tax=Anguilla anguilla TaxID=7936 RepID=A0A0E9XLH8_ANGAN